MFQENQCQSRCVVACEFCFSGHICVYHTQVETHLFSRVQGCLYARAINPYSEPFKPHTNIPEALTSSAASHHMHTTPSHPFTLLHSFQPFHPLALQDSSLPPSSRPFSHSDIFPSPPHPASVLLPPTVKYPKTSAHLFVPLPPAPTTNPSHPAFPDRHLATPGSAQTLDGDPGCETNALLLLLRRCACAPPL